MKRRDRPALMNRARKLHEDAGVPKGPCTFKEIAQFEDFLQMQIAVLSSENCNRVKFIPFLKFIFLCHFFFFFVKTKILLLLFFFVGCIQRG